MDIVNLDLLRALATHHPDGRRKDPHAQHQVVVKALIRQHRRARWLARFMRLTRVFRRRGPGAAKPCPDHPSPP